MAKRSELKVVPGYPEYSVNAQGHVFRDRSRWDDPKEPGVTLLSPAKFYLKSELVKWLFPSK